MEYVEKGDLTMYTSAGIAMNEYMGQVMAGQICAALKYLHGSKITHRDIKPDNILVASHQPYVFKLSDFGLSKIVKDEDTFMKTFCGTILYCAPEIYPGFQRVKMGMPAKRTRHWDSPREQTLPYKHSVDTWGIAAVLFHLLCGRPAWTGTMENQGAVMLENIMTTPVDWERLELAGVSATGIDFLTKMLVVEPAQRATEIEQLAHPWIVQALPSQSASMTSAQVQEGEELDASQLSIAEPQEQSGDDSGLEEEDDPRQSKRVCGWEPPPIINPDGTLRKMSWESNSDDVPPWDQNHPAWPQVMGHKGTAERLTGNDRLFGEISASALRSSGALGHNANAALNIPPSGGQPVFSNISSIDPNYPGPSDNNIHPAKSMASTNAANDHGPQRTSSLLGAEEMVDQLNMASPRSRTSGFSVDSKSAAIPIAVSTREASPSPLGAWHDNTYSDNSNLHLRQGRGDAGHTSHRVAQKSTLGASRRNGMSGSPQNLSTDAQRVSSVTGSRGSLLPTAFNSQDSEAVNEIDTTNGTDDVQDHPMSDPAGLGATDKTVADAGPGTTGMAKQTSSFKEPPFRFGNLVPLAGSIPTVPIKIANQRNSYGRDPASTFPHPDVKAERVPKNALDITMHYPGIDSDIEKGSTDWHLRDELTAIISTRTSRYIKVNGVRLMRGQNCWLFGKLRTGDVVTVFEPVEGRAPKMEGEKQFLKFRCEFFVGASKLPRNENEPFVVLREELSPQETEARKNQGSPDQSR